MRLPCPLRWPRLRPTPQCTIPAGRIAEPHRRDRAMISGDRCQERAEFGEQPQRRITTYDTGRGAAW